MTPFRGEHTAGRSGAISTMRGTAMDGRGGERMNRGIFRQAALDRLAAPDDLDQVIRFSGGGGWFALAGIVLVCAAALGWTLIGLPGPAVATGAGANRTIDVVALGSGVVQSVDVVVGQHVAAGHVVVTIRPAGPGAGVVPPRSGADDAHGRANDFRAAGRVDRGQ
jgi:hypothetical protein